MTAKIAPAPRYAMLLGAAVLCLQVGSGATAAADTAAADTRYEIVQATEERVWRLDRATGEIAVCSVVGDGLVCSISSQAAVPSGGADHDALRSTERERREDDLAFFERIFAMFTRFIFSVMALDREDCPPAAAPQS